MGGKVVLAVMFSTLPNHGTMLSGLLPAMMLLAWLGLGTGSFGLLPSMPESVGRAALFDRVLLGPPDG